MIIDLSEIASHAMFDALGGIMNGGSIELLADGRVLAVMKLSDPAAYAIGNVLEFNEIAGTFALAQGSITSARILAAAGDEILSCDVGDKNSSAVIKLDKTKIYRGDPMRLSSFRLVMP